LSANISGSDNDIDKRKTALSTPVHSTMPEKFGELWSTNHTIYMASVCPPKINRSSTTVLYTSIANIFRTDQAIDKRTTALSTTIPSTFDEKNGELWSTNKRVYTAIVRPPKMNTGHVVWANVIALPGGIF